MQQKNEKTTQEEPVLASEREARYLEEISKQGKARQSEGRQGKARESKRA